MTCLVVSTSPASSFTSRSAARAVRTTGSAVARGSVLRTHPAAASGPDGTTVTITLGR